LKKSKCFYGFRYYSGKDTTWAISGKIAGEMVCFLKESDRTKWIYKQNLSAPSGNGGGVREMVSRKELIEMIGIKEFEYQKELFKNKIEE
jgi:hypothetical protein